MKHLDIACVVTPSHVQTGCYHGRGGSEVSHDDKVTSSYRIGFNLDCITWDHRSIVDLVSHGRWKVGLPVCYL